MPAKHPTEPAVLNGSRRFFYLAAGYLLFAIGAVGAVLPVLPTTVFWIAAAACFANSSPAMYRRILNCPKVGPAIGDYADGGIVRRRSKYMALAGMSTGVVAVMLVPISAAAMGAALAGIAIGAIYVITPPERR